MNEDYLVVTNNCFLQRMEDGYLSQQELPLDLMIFPRRFYHSQYITPLQQ